VELYARVRYAVQIEGLSERAAARRFGIDPRTVAKMMRFSVPAGYRRTKPPAKPKLGAFIAIIDAILAEDRTRPKKQQHTAKRIFERLRDEHGFDGGITIVKDYVAGWRQRAREMFVPLAHPPGHAQVDFGETLGIIGGVARKIHGISLVEPLREDPDILVRHSPPRFETASPLLIAGLGRRFAINDFAGIPALWQEFHPHLDAIPSRKGSATYGVVAHVAAAGDSYFYLAGVEVSDFSDLDPEFTGVRLPAQRWAVFVQEGHITTILSMVNVVGVPAVGLVVHFSTAPSGWSGTHRNANGVRRGPAPTWSAPAWCRP
jgi:predicted transcriptional regulator YdeE